MNEQVLHKLKVLAESAKYDVSCSSSGTVRRNSSGGVGNTVGGWGICHSFAEDGRCISLLKVMLTNYCIYDCAYCINRISNDIPRATLSVSELVELTMEFYRRNYIEGLFLSSGVVRNPDYTMERLVRVAKDLRTIHRFNGYIHLKSIPGASRELVREAGLYADRLMFKMKDDPRITKVGKFIRKTSIDELPQFFNVLKGDMSLVGTRSPTVDEFKQYESHQKRRLSAKPGITGLWQVSGRNEITDFEDVVKLDVQYIDNWSLGLDIKIILKTIRVVFEKGGE